MIFLTYQLNATGYWKQKKTRKIGAVLLVEILDIDIKKLLYINTFYDHLCFFHI